MEEIKEIQDEKKMEPPPPPPPPTPPPPRPPPSQIAMDRKKKREDHVSSMKKRAEYIHRPRPTIYRVPKTIRQCDNDAYEPRLFSIGPYHRILKADDIKYHYLHDFLSRNPRRSLDDYFKEVEKKEARARGCYSEKIPLNWLEFTEVMVLDGCFVIELFLKLWEGRAARARAAREIWEGRADIAREARETKEYDPDIAREARETKEYDPVYSHTWVDNWAANDLLLFENQLPFFILDLLYRLVEFSTTDPLVEIALYFFSDWDCDWDRETVVLESHSVHHLLHLVHFNSFSQLRPSNIPPPPPPITRLIRNISSFCSRLFRAREDKLLPTHSWLRSKSFAGTIPSATRLKDAGVKFSEQKEPESLLDITFDISSGKMEIPYLCVDDGTISLFKNLVAFEQCVPSAGVGFTSYVSFMDGIVNTAQDVEILQSHGIIENKLGSEKEVALLFNRMRTGLIIGEQHYRFSEVIMDAKAYSETKSHARRAMLMRDYFGSPWSIISVMAAAFVILLTLIQAIFAFLSYFQGSS